MIIMGKQEGKSCHVVSCHGMSWHGHHVMSWHGHHVMSCHGHHVMDIMSRTPCHGHHVMSCHGHHVMSCRVMSCHVKLTCHADPCRVEHNIIPKMPKPIKHPQHQQQSAGARLQCEEGGTVSARLQQLGPGTWCDKTVFFAEALPCDIDIHWDHIMWHAW